MRLRHTLAGAVAPPSVAAERRFGDTAVASPASSSSRSHNRNSARLPKLCKLQIFADIQNLLKFVGKTAKSHASALITSLVLARSTCVQYFSAVLFSEMLVARLGSKVRSQSYSTTYTSTANRIKMHTL